MPKIILEKICIWTITLCTVLIFFIPFIVAPATYYPYIFPKIIVFRIIVEIGLMAWIPLMVLDKKYRPPFKHPFVFALSVFVGVLILTMITGVDMYRSFWSTQERMTGVFTMIHFYLWFLMMISIFKTYKEWKMLLLLNISLAFIVALYGFVQRSGDGRAFSFLGNPLYLAVYSMMQIFFILFVICKDCKDKKQRKFFHILLVCLLFFQVYTMFSAGSRTVFASLIIGGCMLCIPFFSFLISKKKFTPIITVGIVTLCGILFLLFANISPAGNTWIKKQFPFAIHRLFFIESYTSLGSRPEIWRMGIEGFKERPLGGWGWENFSYIFNKNYQNPTVGDGEKYFDRSHNQLIDVLSLTGIVGLISYLFLWGVLFFFLLRMIFKEQDIWGKITYATLGALFLGYFLQNLTVFDSPVSLILLYFSFGLAYFMLRKGSIQKDEKEKKREKQVFLNVPARIYVTGIVGTVAVGIVMYWGTIIPLSKSLQGMRGIAILLNQDATPESMYYFKQALDTPSFTNSEIRMELARDILSAKKNLPDQEVKDAIRFTIDELEKATYEQPLNVRNYFFLVDLYGLGGKYGVYPLFAEKAEEVAQKALKLAPNREELYRSMPQLYVTKGDFQKAEEWAKKGLDYNISKKDVHLLIATIWLQAKDFDKAFFELSEAEKNGFLITEQSNFPVYLAMNLVSGQDNKKAVDYVDRLVRETNGSPISLGAQAVVYYKTKRGEEATQIFARIQLADPGFAEQVKQYMQ